MVFSKSGTVRPPPKFGFQFILYNGVLLSENPKLNLGNAPEHKQGRQIGPVLDNQIFLRYAVTDKF